MMPFALALLLLAAPLTRFDQVEVLGYCPAKRALVLAERTLDLPYRFDDVRLVLRAPDSLGVTGSSDVLDGGLVQRLKREGLRPLYDAEVRDRLAKATADLDHGGCSTGLAVAPVDGDPLAAGFALGDVSFALKATLEGGRIVLRLTRREADGTGRTTEAKREIPSYVEGKRTLKGFRPEALHQVVAFPEAGLLAVVLRTNDPPRYEVPAIDLLVTFRLEK